MMRYREWKAACRTDDSGVCCSRIAGIRTGVRIQKKPQGSVDCALPCVGGSTRNRWEENDNEAIWVGDGGSTRERGSLCGAGCIARSAGGESGDDNSEGAVDAVRKKHGGGGGCDAGGEILFQADAG